MTVDSLEEQQWLIISQASIATSPSSLDSSPTAKFHLALVNLKKTKLLLLVDEVNYRFSQLK